MAHIMGLGNQSESWKIIIPSQKFTNDNYDKGNIYLTDTSAKNAVVTILWASYTLDKAESSWSAILGTWCGAALQRALIVKKIFTQLHG